MTARNNKVKDTGFDISSGSKLDTYWRARGFMSLYEKMRSPRPSLKGTETIQELYEVIISEYGFTGLEFGNWVNNESRFNYLVSAVVALEDLQRVLKFPHSNLGLNKISLAFGARGSGSASAHFEPGSFVINMTRYGRDSFFELSGGVGALAHEYGHGLDYFFGTYHAKGWQYRSLTKGRLTAKDFGTEANKNTMHGLANLIVKTMIWEDQEARKLTPYYEALKKKFGDTDYWYRHNELFARAFEQYIDYVLHAKGIKNSFLTSARKYDGKAYMDSKLLKKVVPLFTQLINKMRAVKA